MAYVIIHGEEHFTEGPCNWQGCEDDGVHYVKMDAHVGPYDKAALCHDHHTEWRKGGDGRQGNLDVRGWK